MDEARYIYCTDQSKADLLNEAFLRLSWADDDPACPPSYFTQVTKEGTDEVRVIFKTDDRFHIRVDAPEAVFDELLQPYVDQSLMPQSELDNIHERIRHLAGTGLAIYIYNMLPKVIRDFAKTREQMIADGWLTEDEE